MPEERLVLATAAELGEDVPDPGTFALFSAAQYAAPGFPFVPFRPDTSVRWVRGFRLRDRRPTYLPAQLVYLSWNRLAESEAAIGYATSSGHACGATMEQALVAGLLELLERDAFMIAWTSRLSLPLLDWSGDLRFRRFEQSYFAPVGARHSVVDLTALAGVPAAFALVRGDGERTPLVAVGAGSAPTIGQAWTKALAEAYAVRSWGRGLLLDAPARTFAPDHSDILDFADHIQLYATGFGHRADFLDASPERVPVDAIRPLAGSTPSARLAVLVAALARQGLEAYAVDVTPPDVADAGLAVAKVIVPELCPLDVRYDARFLGGPRLRRRAFELGLRDHPLDESELNHDPHPFP
jgi:ribosomal protein S12 methylthiotransferase accessory factor